MINQKVINAKFENKAHRKEYMAVCETRLTEYKEHIAKMSIPKELIDWENEMIKSNTAMAVGLFHIQKGTTDLTVEDLTLINQLKKEAALVSIGAVNVRPLIALLICVWGEAVNFDNGEWPVKFDERLIKRAHEWTDENRLPEGVVYASKIIGA